MAEEHRLIRLLLGHYPVEHVSHVEGVGEVVEWNEVVLLADSIKKVEQVPLWYSQPLFDFQILKHSDEA